LNSYLLRVLSYGRKSRALGSFDEHRLFPAVDLPPSDAAALPKALRPLSAEWQQRLAQTHSRQFVVLRDGRQTAGWSAPGTELAAPGRLYSITKSVLSLCIGIARSEGLFPPLDEPVFRGLTPRNLLRMDSGLAFDESFDRLSHQTLTYLHPNARRVAYRSPLVDPVAQDFHYNDYYSLLLGVLLEKGLQNGGWKPSTPGLPLVAAWVYERLLLPLGLQNPGRFVLDSVRHGFPKTESGLCLSALDVARVGQLVLQGGQWNGKQLVSPEWLAQSTGRQEAWTGAPAFERYRKLAWGPWLSQGKGFYAWHWWGRLEDQGPDTVFALGIHGQVLLISPKHHTVVVRLADRWSLKGWWPDVILEALESGEL
jgi:CubicO group peptidase (beta-lactamase class C family)